MKIGYVQKTSFIDYPGRICAIVFMQGCNFRCPYCHNPELVDPRRYGDTISRERVVSFLDKRKGKLDAVVITGGEPTLQPQLLGFMESVKSMGYLVKLDTNGSRPNVLLKAFARGLVDYVAMDIKAPWEKYSQVVGSLVDIAQIRKSVRAVRESGIPHEFRTTLVRSLMDPDDILAIGRIIEGASLYVLQKFVPSKHLDMAYAGGTTFSDDEISRLAGDMQTYVDRCITR